MRELFATIVRTALRLFYRQIEVVGLERFPLRGPVVVAANHFNSLADALLLIAVLPRIPAFAVAIFLFKHPVVGRMLRWLGCVPIHRAVDEGADPRENVASLNELGAKLRAGEVVAIFPEGVTVLGPQLQRIKVGTARLAFGAESQADWQIGLCVLPVGLQYENAPRWRSAVRIEIGEPMSPAEYRSHYEEHSRRAMGEFTKRLEEQLRLVSLHAETWEERGEALFAARCYLAELRSGKVTHPIGGERQGGAVEAGSRTAETFLAWHRNIRDRKPKEVASVLHRLRRLRKALELMGLTVEDLDKARKRRRVARSIGWRAALWTFAIPLSAWGRVNSWLAEKTVVAYGRRFNPGGDVSHVTWLVMPGLIIAPVVHLLQTGIVFAMLCLAGMHTGVAALWSVAYFGSLIPTWMLSLRLRDLRHEGVRWAKALAILTGHRRLVPHMLRERFEIAQLLERLVKEAAATN